MLAEDVGDQAALRALAKRGEDSSLEPIPVEDDDLRRLRDAFIGLDRDEQAEVGPRLGRAIGVRGFRWERGKRVRTTVPLGLAYLPRHLDDRPDGWARAAARLTLVVVLPSSGRALVIRMTFGGPPAGPPGRCGSWEASSA